jgi:hypothetical protein
MASCSEVEAVAALAAGSVLYMTSWRALNALTLVPLAGLQLATLSASSRREVEARNTINDKVLRISGSL